MIKLINVNARTFRNNDSDLKFYLNLNKKINDRFDANKKNILNNINLNIEKNKNYLLTGGNGSGKTTLAKIIQKKGIITNGNVLYDNKYIKNSKNDIIYTSFSDSLSIYNLTEKVLKFGQWGIYNIDSLKVKSILNKHAINDPLIKNFIFENNNNKLNQLLTTLSTGELKKILLINTLYSKKRLIILDEVFDGLDKKSCIDFSNVIKNYINLNKDNNNLILISHRLDEINNLNSILTNHIKMKNGKIIEHDENYLINNNNNVNNNNNNILNYQKNDIILNNLLNKYEKDAFYFWKKNDNNNNNNNNNKLFIHLDNITLSINNKILLKNFNYKILYNNKYQIIAPNGYGKSLLLKSIIGEKLSAYNDIKFYINKNGEIINNYNNKLTQNDKRKFISLFTNELQIKLNQYNYINPMDIILSGFFGISGPLDENIRKQITKQHIKTAKSICKILNIDPIIYNNQSSLFTELSQGQQVLILLARALVKGNPLLILDEPFSGLAIDRREYMYNLLNNIVNRYQVTILFVCHNNEKNEKFINNVLNLTDYK